MPPPPIPLDRQLLEFALGIAEALRSVLVTILVLAAIVGAAAGLWALRPSPTFSSDDVATGSPFDVTFHVKNDNPWLTLFQLKIGCVLAQVRALPIAPTLVDATNVRFAGQEADALAPDEPGIFTCPFRAVLGQQTEDELGIAQRAEIYFRSTYDLPLIGSLRLTRDSPHFFLNTALLPPRWTPRPDD